jgi:hypothetical protein
MPCAVCAVTLVPNGVLLAAAVEEEDEVDEAVGEEAVWDARDAADEGDEAEEGAAFCV